MVLHERLTAPRLQSLPFLCNQPPRSRFLMRHSRFFPRILTLAATTALALSLTGLLQAAGLHPGFASVVPQLSGELLLGELNCLACHAGSDAVKRRLASNEAPLLGGKGLAITPQYLRKFLENPQAGKPG